MQNWRRGEVYEKTIRFAVDELYPDGKIVIAQSYVGKYCIDPDIKNEIERSSTLPDLGNA